MQLTQQEIRTFQQKILDWYAENKRDLPWRKTRNPYHIFISEVMAQQTQLSRVIPKYLAWVERFPAIESLANASTREVLSAWSGLGYNRRALYLQKAAKDIVEKFGGILPKDSETLKKLPGIGEYTAGAIACFAFDEQVAVVDTNVRRVILTHFVFCHPEQSEGSQPWLLDKGRDSSAKPQNDRKKEINNKTVQVIAEQLLPSGQAYEWNQALMDYAAMMLQKEKIPIKKQSRFKDSDRYYRGQIIKLLIKHEHLPNEKMFTLLEKEKGFNRERFERIIGRLINDRLVKKDHAERIKI